ncbi:MAG: shikimate dehydrogenase, partial [Candidatus Omnitrophica bacterium]|nr:shikimate dehydrogenase [Candidatus Omnitrophota bacterium]
MKINARTEIYGLLGYPVHHTFSPVMHNSAFEDLGINAIYLPFEIKSEDLESSVECLKSIGVKGLNVTIPHKERVIKYLDSLDREAALIGAVNTIVNIKGKYKGYNTDGRGFISSIEEEFGIVPKGKKFFIIGAGGAARAVSFSLALRGACRIVLVDRVGKKAI